MSLQWLFLTFSISPIRLDSLIIGEGQILSQVRQCHLHSIHPTGSGGKILSRLLNQAVTAGKRVRSETSIAKGSVSISSAAVELSELMASKDLNLPFEDARMSVVGAGKMTKLLVTHLASRGVEKITIVNRSVERANELKTLFPDMNIEVKLMDDIWDVVSGSDVVFTATASSNYIFTGDRLTGNNLPDLGKPLMLVDISVPRNVEDSCKDVPGVKMYNVDALKAVVAKNTAKRQKEILEAEVLLREEAEEFVAWKESLSAIPTINRMQEKAEKYRKQELKKCTKKLKDLSDKELEAVERLSRGIVNKLLHHPLTHLRKTAGVDEKKRMLKELNDMFELKKDAK